MHELYTGCSQSTNPYAVCTCDERRIKSNTDALNNHTEEIRRFRESYADKIPRLIEALQTAKLRLNTAGMVTAEIDDILQEL